MLIIKRQKNQAGFFQKKNVNQKTEITLSIHPVFSFCHFPIVINRGARFVVKDMTRHFLINK